MAFCNTCGTTLQPGVRFCPKCGTANPEVGVATPAPPVQKSNDTLRIVLIAVAGFIALCVIGIAAATFIGLRIARHSRVEQSGNNVRVQTPFGSVVTTKDPDEVARNLGVDVYPGARVLENGAADVQVGGMHTTSVQLESDDPADKVADFYKKRFPNANVNVSNQDHYTIVSSENNNLVTINIESQGNKTEIHIANVLGRH